MQPIAAAAAQQIGWTRIKADRHRAAVGVYDCLAFAAGGVDRPSGSIIHFDENYATIDAHVEQIWPGHARVPPLLFMLAVARRYAIAERGIHGDNSKRTQNCWMASNES